MQNTSTGMIDPMAVLVPGSVVATTFVTGNTDATSTSETGLPPTDDMGCIAYAAKAIECFPRYADHRATIASQCAEYKMQGLELDGQPCADAIAAQNVCFSQAGCAMLESGERAPARPPPSLRPARLPASPGATAATSDPPGADPPRRFRALQPHARPV